MAKFPFDSLLRELARRDFLTYQHSIAVAENMKAFAEKMGFDHDQVQLSEMLGAVHDLAKLNVPEALFRKLQAGQVPTKDEREQLKSNASDLLHLLGDGSMDPVLKQSIECMECRFDGKGLPATKGEAIPILARMLMIVNYQDMLTRQRTGRKSLNDEQVSQVLRKNAGVLFDPTLVEVFLDG